MVNVTGLELAAERNEAGKWVVTVASVDATGTVADSGIQKGDTILQIRQIPVSEPDQALRNFWSRSFLRQLVAAVLVERGKNILWMPLAMAE